MGFKEWFRPKVETISPDDTSGPQQLPSQQHRSRRRRGEPKRTNRSAISPLTLVAIQASVSTADGLVTSPVKRAGQGKVGSYIQGMVTPPKRAHITVVAVRRDELDTVVTVVITTSEGEKVSEHASPNALWDGNITATANTITGTLLKIPGQQPFCEKELAALVAAPIGMAKKFSIGPGNRLAITNGDD